MQKLKINQSQLTTQIGFLQVNTIFTFLNYFVQVFGKSFFKQNRIKMISSRSLIIKASELENAGDRFKFWNPKIAGPVCSPRADITLQRTFPDQSQLSYSAEFNYSKPNEEDQSLLKQSLNETNQLEEELESLKTKLQQERVKAEEEMEVLRARIQQSRVLNQDLIKQLNKANNEMRIANALVEEVNSGREKIVEQIHKSHEAFNEIQKQKIVLINKQSQLINQGEITQNRIQILEGQVEGLTKKLNFSYEEINFERELNVDHQREMAVLKAQLQKYLICAQDYDKMQSDVNETTLLNKQINAKFQTLQAELEKVKKKIGENQIQEKVHSEEHNKLFQKIQELEKENEHLKQQLVEAREHVKVKNEEIFTFQKSKCEFQDRYKAVVYELETKTQNLLFELMALDKRNRDLVDEKNFYKGKLENSEVNRDQNISSQEFMAILKNQLNQINILQRKLNQKEEEIDRLKQKYEIQECNWRQKADQLMAVLNIREIEDRNKDRNYEIEMNTLKNQCGHLCKKIDELKSKQAKMKTEISEKDRIIINHVQNVKKQKPAVRT